MLVYPEISGFESTADLYEIYAPYLVCGKLCGPALFLKNFVDDYKRVYCLVLCEEKLALVSFHQISYASQKDLSHIEPEPLPNDIRVALQRDIPNKVPKNKGLI